MSAEDANLFMMCASPNEAAYSELPPGYHIRLARRDELAIWMAFPFDGPADMASMQRYYASVYADREAEFYERCLFVCDGRDRPVGTLFAWRIYDCATTLHWYKVRKECEGRGIGRALLTHVMRGIPAGDYPVFLHTQPGSFRAIKLYSDFGFALLTDDRIGSRDNELQSGMAYLKQHMPPDAYESLRMATAPDWFLRAASATEISQF